MERWNLSLMLGVILMVRTQKGRATIDALSRPRRAWNFFGDLGVATTILGMLAMTALMLFSMLVSLRPDSGIRPATASEVLVIPGVNPLVPLWYGIAALIITLVVHEGGHGILARANDLRVKSLGLLFAIVPIGAFVEPEEEDLNTASRRKRLRVFAAGPMVNIVVAAAVFFAFAGLMASAEPEPGLHVLAVTTGMPAADAGILPGDRLVMADGQAMANNAAFGDYMDTVRPGDTVHVVTHDGREAELVTVSRWDSWSAEEQAYWMEQDPAFAEAAVSDSVIGVSIFQGEAVQQTLSKPTSLAAFGAVVALPFGELYDTPYLSVLLPAFFSGPFDGFWIVTTLLYWVFWINLMVGLTNILPMLPLDGGHIFRDVVGSIAERVRPRMDAERRDRLVGRAAGAISIVILAAFLIQVFAPRIVQ